MEDTRRRIIAGYAIFTLLFLSGVFLFTLFRIDMLSLDNKAIVASVVDKLRTDLVLKFALKGNFGENEISSLFTKALSDEPRLLVVAVTTRQYGILKAVGKSKAYLVNAQFDDPGRDIEFKKPLGAAELSPDRSGLTLTYQNVTYDARLRVLYISFSNRDSAELLREILIVLLCFSGLTFVMIVITSLVSRREERIVARSTTARPAEEPLDLPDVPAHLAPRSAARREPAPPVRLPALERELPADDLEIDDDDGIEEIHELGSDPEYSADGIPEEFPGSDPGDAPLEAEDPFADDTPAATESPVPGNLEWSDEEREERKRDRYDERTGLVKNEHFREWLGNEIERAVSFGEDLALVFVSVSGAPVESITWRELVAPTLHRVFGNPDLAFAYNEEAAAVITPGLGLDAAIRAAKLFYKQLFESGFQPCLGITARNGRTVTPSLFIEEAAQALAQAKTGGQSPIIAFRADTGR